MTFLDESGGRLWQRLGACVFPLVLAFNACADIGIISPGAAAALTGSADPAEQAVVLDTRGGYKDYFRAHLPKAQHFNSDTLRGIDAGIPVQYLPPEITIPLLIRAGATVGKTHIIYTTGAKLPNDEILSATMVAYVLEKYGIEDIRIVDGGLRDWKAACLPVTQEYFGNPPGRLPERRKPEVAATYEDIFRSRGKKDFILVDARPLDEFQGKDEVWLRKGHLRGAISFHRARLMDPENTHRFKNPEEIEPQLEAAGITPDKQIICYCGTSREGSLLRFYLKHAAKYPNVRLYEGAWKEYLWLENRSLPIEEGGEAAGTR